MSKSRPLQKLAGFAGQSRWVLIPVMAIAAVAGLLFAWNRHHSAFDRQPFTVRAEFVSEPFKHDTCVIFVHGVLGSAPETWLNADNTFPRLLASDPEFSSAVDVFVFEYYTPKFGSAASIVDLAAQLRGRLEFERIPEWQKRSFFSATAWAVSSSGDCY